MRKVLVLVAVIGLGLSSGCRTITKEASDQIAVEASSTEADLREWDKLTDDQKKHAAWLRGRAFADLNLSVNGKAIPPAFATDPWKPATAPAPGGGK
jgi:uncharacterized protein YceK